MIRRLAAFALAFGISAGSLAMAPGVASAETKAAESGCGFHRGVNATWKNCSSHNYTIMVAGYNGSDPTGPGKSKTLCVRPGTTNLDTKLPVWGFILHASKFNNDNCKAD